MGGSPCGQSRCENAALDKVLGGRFRTSKNEPLSTHATHWLIEQKPHRYKLMPEIAGLRRSNEVCGFQTLQSATRRNLVPTRRVDAVSAAVVTSVTPVSGRYIWMVNSRLRGSSP